MIIDAEANIKWLNDRLYEARRFLEAEGVENPVFVLLTKSREERCRVENIFFDYFKQIYGGEFFKHIMAGSTTPTMTRIELPSAGAHIVLIDI